MQVEKKQLIFKSRVPSQTIMCEKKREVLRKRGREANAIKAAGQLVTRDHGIFQCFEGECNKIIKKTRAMDATNRFLSNDCLGVFGGGVDATRQKGC